MRGTVRKITIPRRLVADLMHASMRVPFVSLARPLNIRSLLEARAQAAQPLGWAAIFIKAFALVAKDQPVLRTLYVKWPWPAFYELPRELKARVKGRLVLWAFDLLYLDGFDLRRAQAQTGARRAQERRPEGARAAHPPPDDD